MTGQDEDRALDDVDTPETALPPAVGNWLHFDVQTACAGDMLCAALLNLGVSSAILRDGLARVGLHPAVGPRLTQTKRNGVAGLHLCFVKRDGHAVDGGVLDPPSAFVPPKDHPRGRHRLRQPTLRTRTALQVAEAGVEQETERETAEVITLHHGQPSAEVAAPAPDDVMRWLDGQAATGEALERRLAQGRLSPIAAAISRKALRRLLDGLAQVQGIARDAVVLEGPAAVDVLCDIVGFASLIEAVNPARITASFVGVTTAQTRGGGGPEPWVVEVLKDVPTRERDQVYPACTPTGAALIWAVTHHFGARLGAVVRRVGVGAGSRDIRGVSNITRALFGELPKESAGETRSFSALIRPVVTRDVFLHDLVEAGATHLFFAPGTDRAGNVVERVTGLCGTDDEDRVVEVLVVQGAAADTVMTPAFARAPSVETLTVQSGSPQKGDHVELHVISLQGKRVSVVVDQNSAMLAARRLGWELSAVEAAARLAFERQSGEDGPDVPTSTSGD